MSNRITGPLALLGAMLLAAPASLAAQKDFRIISSEAKVDHVPGDLEDAHDTLGRILTKDALEFVRSNPEKEMIVFHMSLGRWIRNNWLTRKSTLLKQLKDYGLCGLDDMSQAIIETFWCKLHDQPFRIEERARDCQEFYRAAADPVGASPTDGAEIEWLITKGGTPHAVHLGLSMSDKTAWRSEYNSGRGIEPATSAERDELQHYVPDLESLNSCNHPKGDGPEGGADILWAITKPAGKIRCAIRIGYSLSDATAWRYVYGSGRGVEPATAEDREELEKTFPRSQFLKVYVE